MGTQPDSQQRCCLGLMYYSQALQEQGKRPVCLGIPHAPSEPVHLEDHRQLTGPADFKLYPPSWHVAAVQFVCLGHSLYERPAAPQQGSGDASSSNSNSSQPAGVAAGRLPYCEGLEVILGSTVDAAAPAGAHAPSGAPGLRPPDDLSAVLTSIFGGDDSAVVRGFHRFNNSAARNWDRMKSTAGQAYSMTIKPLIDKLSGGQ